MLNKCYRSLLVVYHYTSLQVVSYALGLISIRVYLSQTMHEKCINEHKVGSSQPHLVMRCLDSTKVILLRFALRLQGKNRGEMVHVNVYYS